jgi:hypothetical protein
VGAAEEATNCGVEECLSGAEAAADTYTRAAEEEDEEEEEEEEEEVVTGPAEEQATNAD